METSKIQTIRNILSRSRKPLTSKEVSEKMNDLSPKRAYDNLWNLVQKGEADWFTLEIDGRTRTGFMLKNTKSKAKSN